MSDQHDANLGGHQPPSHHAWRIRAPSSDRAAPRDAPATSAGGAAMDEYREAHTALEGFERVRGVRSRRARRCSPTPTDFTASAGRRRRADARVHRRALRPAAACSASQPHGVREAYDARRRSSPAYRLCRGTADNRQEPSKEHLVSAARTDKNGGNNTVHGFLKLRVAGGAPRRRLCASRWRRRSTGVEQRLRTESVLGWLASPSRGIRLRGLVWESGLHALSRDPSSSDSLTRASRVWEWASSRRGASHGDVLMNAAPRRCFRRPFELNTPPIGEMRCSSGGKRLAHPNVPGLYGG